MESYIQIETNALSYIIGKVLNQLNLDFNTLSKMLNKSNFGQWRLIVYFARKMIFVKT